MTPAVRSTPRQIVLDGPLNTRDLGGLPVTSGGATRFGVILRSDAPTMLSERDALLLTSIGVGTVIDLRTETERLRFGVVDLGEAQVDIAHVPLFDEQPDQAAWHQEADLGRLNRDLLDDAGARIVEVLRIATRAAGTTMVHCTAGKDRTGVVAAAALLLAGVRRSSIVADYSATEASLPAMRSRFADWEGTQPVAPSLFRAPAEVMEATIDHLDERYGGALAWARAWGWTDADQHALHARFVDASATPLPAEG